MYLAIFVPAMAVNAYTILQLQQFEQVTRYTLDADNKMRDYEKKLTDSLLSQVRHERKYIIIKDATLYDRFLLAERDFSQYLNEAIYIADTAP